MTVSRSALPADAMKVDKKHPMWQHVLSRPDQLKAVAAADEAVDMLGFVQGLAFLTLVLRRCRKN